MYFHQTGCYSLFVQEPVKRASPFSLFFFILWMQGTLLSWQVLRPTKETAKWENFGVYLVSIQWLICWRVSSKEREREKKARLWWRNLYKSFQFTKFWLTYLALLVCSKAREDVFVSISCARRERWNREGFLTQPVSLYSLSSLYSETVGYQPPFFCLFLSPHFSITPH